MSIASDSTPKRLVPREHSPSGTEIRPEDEPGPWFEARQRDDARPHALASPRAHMAGRSRALAHAHRSDWSGATLWQRAWLATRPSGLHLGDELRLVRWELERGGWREALEAADRVYASLSATGKAPRIATWLCLARAVAHFQLGAGPRSRRALARALRQSRCSHVQGVLEETALRLGRAFAGLRGDLAAQRVYDLRLGVCGPHARPGDRVANTRPRLERALVRSGLVFEEESERARPPYPARPSRSGPVTGGAFWAELPRLLEGPPEAATLARMLPRGDAFSLDLGDSGSGTIPLARRSDTGPRANTMSVRSPILEQWLRTLDVQPSCERPAWFVALLCGLVEEEMSALEECDRTAIERGLADLVTRTHEPHARARALQALAEASLTNIGCESGMHEAPERVARARADLGLAAGLFRRLKMPRQSAHCEEWWSRLARVRAGVGAVSGSGPRGAERRLTLKRVRQRCAEAGFLTADRHLLTELATLSVLAPSPLPVLIGGESGTGKEIVARAVHGWSGLRGDFMAIHCGAIPRDLLESELFGHVRGAFTGAAADKPGLVEAAHGGTLFLDEIGEMSPEAQMKMLRVLETGEVRRVGDVRTRKVSIRLVVATHRDLEESVREGRFRLDLLHRIRGLVVRLSPLRDRPNDIALLVERFLETMSRRSGALGISDPAMAALLHYGWPGNVREMRSRILRAAYLSAGLGRTQLDVDVLDLPGMELDGLATEGAGSTRATLVGASVSSGWATNAAAGTPVYGAPDAAADTRSNGAPGSASDVPAVPSARVASPPPERPPHPMAVMFPEDEPPRPEPEAGYKSALTPDLVRERGLDRILQDIERDLIVRALETNGWNRTHAARELGGVSRTTLISKMKRLGIA